jgi:hypothetical protein
MVYWVYGLQDLGNTPFVIIRPAVALCLLLDIYPFFKNPSLDNIFDQSG